MKTEELDKIRGRRTGVEKEIPESATGCGGRQ